MFQKGNTSETHPKRLIEAAMEGVPDILRNRLLIFITKLLPETIEFRKRARTVFKRKRKGP